MNFFFQTKVDSKVLRLYRWIPVSFIVFLLTMVFIILFPEFKQNEALFFLAFVMMGYNITLSIFCIQALARIESESPNPSDTDN